MRRRTQWGMSHAHWHYRSYADYSLEAADGTNVGTGRLPANRRRRPNQIIGQKTGVRRGRRADLARGGGEGRYHWGGGAMTGSSRELPTCDSIVARIGQRALPTQLQLSPNSRCTLRGPR